MDHQSVQWSLKVKIIFVKSDDLIFEKYISWHLRIIVDKLTNILYYWIKSCRIQENKQKGEILI